MRAPCTPAVPHTTTCTEGRTVLVSSHLMSEMALTADHLLIIGRGRMIADMPLSELMGRRAGERVEVRSADPQRMAADLRAAGPRVTLEPDVTLGVAGLESRQIGELAAERGHVLHQLRDVAASLEGAYFRLTGESVEYRAAVLTIAGRAIRTCRAGDRRARRRGCHSGSPSSQ
jgi:ABC-2 type transport system ATP-binding protein